MKLSIIIPAYNEEKTIAEVLRRLDLIKLDGIDKELLVVNDGSQDGTLKEIERVKSKIKNLTVIDQPKNQGKGAAVKAGIERAKGEYILIQDADFEYDPTDIGKLVAPVHAREANVVYGTRLKRMPNFSRDERTLRFLVHYFGNKGLSLITSLLYAQWVTDMETGYKLFPKAALEDTTIHSKSFNFEPEITAKLMKKGYKIHEIPIKTNPRGYDEGKKLNTVHDGIIALWTIFKYRFVN